MINELIETEQDYVKDLGSIVEVRRTFLFNSLPASGNLSPTLSGMGRERSGLVVECLT